MSFVNGAFPSTVQTVVGRFPWRTLGTGPLLDGYGECLWYIVSANFKSLGMDAGAAMNWDALGQIDIVTTNNTANLQSHVTNAHNRPVAIVFSPGPPLGSQVRGQIGSDVVTECGGNYNPANYLEPDLTAAILDYDTDSTSTYFAGAIATDTSQTSLLAISTQGRIVKDGTDLKSACPSATDCGQVANDIGLSITSETLFGAMRKSSYFRTDINLMLDHMVACLRDEIIAGGGSLSPAYGYITGADNNSCYGAGVDPKGYYPHYKEMIFVAAPAGGVNVAVDGGPAQACAGALLFAGQRDSTTLRCPVGAPVNVQKRSSSADRLDKCNYLEGDNLTSFTGSGTTFTGQSQFARVSATQTAHQDIVRCIPSGPPGGSFTSVPSPALASGGFSQISAYDAATQTLTLGALGVNTGNGAPTYALYGCSWTPEAHLTSTGLRAYFRVKIIDRGDGFVFAMIDGDRNSASVCGAARQHLAYSGNNDPDQSSNGLLPSVAGNETAIIEYPKIGIEFDTTKATGTTSTSGDPLSAGRNDPDYTPPQDNDAHAAIVYWGGETAIATGTPCNASNQCPHTGNNCNQLGRCPAVRYCNATDHMCYLRPEYDDNVHGFPQPPDASPRPSPRNHPAVDPFPSPVFNPAPGLASIDRLGSTTASERDFHVRVELARNYVGSPTDAKDRKGSYKLEAWIVPESATVAAQITAMKNTTRPLSELYPGFAATLSNDGIRYDEPRGACALGICAAGQVCAAGTCYTTGPPIIHDLPMGSCNAQQKCSGPPLLKRNACAPGNVCPSNQSCGADNFCYDALYSCGSDNVCYGEAFRTMRLGFTNGQGTQDQVINISDFVTTWLP